MNPRLGLARHLIVYAFMQQCDDVETIYQSVLKNLPEKKRRKRERDPDHLQFNGRASITVKYWSVFFCSFVHALKNMYI